jgi:hypothetical protein
MKKGKKQSSQAGAGEPGVNCAFDKLEDPKSLRPNEDNPNGHPDEQLRLYAKILRHQGFRKPAIVSNQTGLIVTGHGLVLTAIAEGWKQVPVDYQDFRSREDEYAHMLADNRLPQLADLNEAEFTEILRVELDGKLDLELAGIPLEEEEPAVTLKPVDTKPPPKMAWVLIGIPLVRFSEINGDIERIAGLAETVVESTVNDVVPVE